MSRPPPPAAADSRGHRATGVQASLILFLLVVGVRCWIVREYTSSLPYWDQWGGEGSVLLKPWLEGTLRWANLWAPHNEHRIVLTRLLVIGLFAVNGQWDNHLEMATNALWCGLAAVVTARLLAEALPARWRRSVWTAVALLFVLPFGWEATTSGFNSQYYFLWLFSFVAVWGLAGRAPFTKGWWYGAGALAAAALSMASGFLAALAVLGWQLAQSTRPGRPYRGRRQAVTAAWCLVVAAVGWTTRVTVPQHQVLATKSGPEFAWALLRALAWPYCAVPAAAFALYLPAAALFVTWWRRARSSARSPSVTAAAPDRFETGAALLLPLTGWTLLQSAAFAVARGGNGILPASRYQDLLAVGSLVNLLAALLLCGWSEGRWPVAAGRAARGLTVGWILVVLTGLTGLTWTNLSVDLPVTGMIRQRQENNVRDFVRTGDATRYLGGAAPSEVPYPDAAALRAMLEDHTLRAILPASVRAPLAFLDPAVTDGAFVPGGAPVRMDNAVDVPTWGSFGPRGEAATGTFRAGLQPHLPVLRMRLAGYLGRSGLTLTLTTASRSHPEVVRPHWLPRERWRNEYLWVPRTRAGGLVWVDAADRDPTTWFAFSEPVEVGFWSYWAGYLLRHAGWLVAGALLWAAGIGLWRWVRDPVAAAPAA